MTGMARITNNSSTGKARVQRKMDDMDSSLDKHNKSQTPRAGLG